MAHKLSEVFTAISFCLLHFLKTKNLHVEKKLGISMPFYIHDHSTSCYTSLCFNDTAESSRKETQCLLQYRTLAGLTDKSHLTFGWLGSVSQKRTTQTHCQNEPEQTDRLRGQPARQFTDWFYSP